MSRKLSFRQHAERIMAELFTLSDPYPDHTGKPVIVGRSERGFFVKANSGEEALRATVEGTTPAHFSGQGASWASVYHIDKDLYDVHVKAWVELTPEGVKPIDKMTEKEYQDFIDKQRGC